MPPVVPDEKNIRSFRTEAALERWLAANHARASELWLEIRKEGSACRRSRSSRSRSGRAP